MTREEMLAEINALKQLLSMSDYKALKFAEGEISPEDYTEIREQRQGWRDKINRLEDALALLPEEAEELEPAAEPEEPSEEEPEGEAPEAGEEPEETLEEGAEETDVPGD